jgi:hypothetical protein
VTDASVPPVPPAEVAGGLAGSAMLEGHGAQHPLCSPDSARRPWRLGMNLYLWNVDGAVVIQGVDGDVTIPPNHLPALARGLLAMHVTNGRPDRRPKS